MHHEKSCCGFNSHYLASAAAIVMAVVYFICVAVSALWPETFLNLMNTMAHAIDLTKGAPGPQITAGNVVIGFVQTVVYTYAVVYLFAWIYNKFLGTKTETSSHCEEKTCCRST